MRVEEIFEGEKLIGKIIIFKKYERFLGRRFEGIREIRSFSVYNI